MRKWRIEDSAELYNINGWGVDYFSINHKGNVEVRPTKNGVAVDLKELLDELMLSDVSTPVLVRFPDILDDRIITISRCFKSASEEYNYNAQNFIIYPIKVNQMRPVVEEIVSHGKKFNIGLEAGSKPELHAVIAINTDPESLIICNGYKDEDYIELALLAQKMGKRIFLVVEKLNELKLITSIAKRLKVKPNLGIRIKDKLGTYSKGMTRKVMLARSLMSKPRLAILDEATSGLDVINAMEIRNMIVKYAKAGTTVLVSSHNMLEIEYLSNMVGIIDQGRIIETGTVIELKNKHHAQNLEQVFLSLKKK